MVVRLMVGLLIHCTEEWSPFHEYVFFFFYLCIERRDDVIRIMLNLAFLLSLRAGGPVGYFYTTTYIATVSQLGCTFMMLGLCMVNVLCFVL